MRPDTLVTLPDYLPQHPDILFVGINPGSYSAQQGHYYARATNRFWWALQYLRPHPCSTVATGGLARQPIRPWD